MAIKNGKHEKVSGPIRSFFEFVATVFGLLTVLFIYLAFTGETVNRDAIFGGLLLTGISAGIAKLIPKKNRVEW